MYTIKNYHKLAIEQPLTRSQWNPPQKKDTPHPRTKDKPQPNSRRGTIIIKSNLIPTKWATHKLENNNKEVFTLLWRFSTPRSGSIAWGSGQGTGNPMESDFEGKRDWLQSFHRMGRNRILESTNKILCTAVTPQETEPQLPVSEWGSPTKAQVGSGLPQSQRC